MKLKTIVFVLVLFLSFIPTTLAEDDPPDPPVIPPYIKHTHIDKNWTYCDGTLLWWALYKDESNSTIESARIYIDDIPYDIHENTSLEFPTEKNFWFQKSYFDRGIHTFYFEINSAISNTKTFEIVNRDPYLLETPPVKMEVTDEFEWQARAHDPDMDFIHWNWSSNITESSEWEFQPNNTTMKLKIKCDSPFHGWVNVSIYDNYTYDYWNWTLICYGVNQERSPPPIPRSVNRVFQYGEDTPTRASEPESEPEPLADDPPTPMATESLYPDGVTFTLTQLTGAYTDVDDDPDSPDGLWLAASGNNVNTAVLASFPSPTGNPTVGADLQEFRTLVRQYDEGQTGTPDARIELWENGGLIRAGSDTSVPQGGIVLSFTWNANELGTADGSQVECNVVGTKSGGAPGARNTVEPGAIEWNVVYSANTAPTIDDKIVEEYWTYNVSMAHQWNSTDPDPEANTWSMGGDPGYLTLDQGYRTAFINGTCTDPGKSHPIYLNVTDGTDSDQEIFTLYCVNVAPTIDDPIVEEYWTDGVAMAHQWNSTDADLHSNTWTMDGNPGYLSYENGYRTTWINGTCNDPGKSHPIYLNVTDGSGSDQEIFTLFCAAAAPNTDYYWFGHVDSEWDNVANWEPTSAGDYPRDADDRVFIDDEITPNLNIVDGANVQLVIGYLQVNSTYTGTMTSLLDLILDSSGIHNGSIAADGGTWDLDSYDLNIDGDCYIGSTTISNPARFTFQGGVTQNLQTAGNTLYQVTVDNVASTVLYIKDDITMFDLTILAAGEYKIDSVTESTNIVHKFTDAANCGFVSSSSGTLTLIGDGVTDPTITSTVTPPTNKWSWQGALDITADYTTFNYDSSTVALSGSYDIEDSTWSNSYGYAMFFGTGATVTKFDDNTVTHVAAPNGNLVFYPAGVPTINNFVGTSTGSIILYVNNNQNPLEFLDSNFDITKVFHSGNNGWLISKTHNDVANAYAIRVGSSQTALKSSITNDFGTGNDVRLYYNKFQMDEDGVADTIRFDSGTTFQIGKDTPTGSRTLTFDDSAGAGFHASSAGTLIGKGTVANGMIITSAATPPTDYWSGDMSTGDPTITMDYTTLSYGTLLNTGGTWDIDDCTFDNFKNTAYSLEIETGATITSFTDNTISNAGYGLDVQVAYTGFDNIVVSSMSSVDIRANDVDIEFINSNFDVTQVNLATTGNVFSDVHDDMTNAFKVICSNADKSGISNDFGSADKVEFVSNGCLFTIDEDAEATDVWIQTNTVVTQDTATTWTISGNGNLSVNGSLVSSGIIEYSGAQWFTFYIGYWAYLYLNTSTVINADIVESFNYTIGASNTGAVNELNITQPAGADNVINITQRDFSLKGSGTVLTFGGNNSANVNTGYNVDNLTTGNAYEVSVNGTVEYTLDAVGGAISFSYTSEGEREFAVSYAANVSTTTDPGNGTTPTRHLRVYISYNMIDYRTFDFNSNLVGTDPPYRFQWTFGDGYTSTERNPNHEYDLGFALWMDYDVHLTVEDDKRRTLGDDISIRVFNWPVIFIVAFIIAICLVGLVIAVRSKE